MKARFLDIRNCHALLPSGNLGNILKKLEICLAQLNDNSEQFRHHIDDMVKHNQATQGKLSGRKRCLASSLEIAIALIYKEDAINVRAAEFERLPGMKIKEAQLHIIRDYKNGSVWKTILPLQFILKGWGDANSGYQGYVHIVSKNMPRNITPQHNAIRNYKGDDDYYYVGLTGRNWLQRFSEHMGEIRRECRYRFHQALKESLGLEDVLFTSMLDNINMTYEEAMNWEEAEVDRIASDEVGLNMIPGGFKGLKLLHERKAITSLDVKLEERDKAIANYIRKHPREGVPNPFMSELWEDDEFYLSVNEAIPKRLTAHQVERILHFNEMGWPISKITIEVGALHDKQVKGVLKGENYSRTVEIIKQRIANE